MKPDGNREQLMTDVLVAQAKQHRSMRDIVIQYGDAQLSETSMGDAFWPAHLPAIWKAVKAALENDTENDAEADEDSSKKKKKRRMSSASTA